jgi:hypothetical protein
MELIVSLLPVLLFASGLAGLVIVATAYRRRALRAAQAGLAASFAGVLPLVPDPQPDLLVGYGAAAAVAYFLVCTLKEQVSRAGT